MSIEPAALLVRQSVQRGVQLLHGHFSLVDFAGRHSLEQRRLLNAVPGVQRVERLVVDNAAEIVSLLPLGLLERRGYLVGDFDEQVVMVKGIVVPYIDGFHLFILRSNF